MQDARILTAAPMEANLTLNSRTYAKPTLNERWTPKETHKFYQVGPAVCCHPPCSTCYQHAQPGACRVQALETFGTDFSLISEMFPTRPRRSIKSKYLRESKTNMVSLFPAVHVCKQACRRNVWSRKAGELRGHLVMNLCDSGIACQLLTPCCQAGAHRGCNREAHEEAFGRPGRCDVRAAGLC